MIRLAYNGVHVPEKHGEDRMRLLTTRRKARTELKDRRCWENNKFNGISTLYLSSGFAWRGGGRARIVSQESTSRLSSSPPHYLVALAWQRPSLVQPQAALAGGGGAQVVLRGHGRARVCGRFRAWARRPRGASHSTGAPARTPGAAPGEGVPAGPRCPKSTLPPQKKSSVLGG
jgi:hypothetical protein